MKKILLIHTGGTFGMIPVKPSQVLAPADIKDLILKNLPDIKKIARVDFKIAFNIDSANIQIHHWRKLAQIISENYPEYDGFVIIHGTDSMIYTASALSFILRGLNKPVTLTGSQRPLAFIRSDAKSNLINSIELATLKIPEVSICFGTKLFRGNRTIKISSTSYNAFASPNFSALADVGWEISLSPNILSGGKKLILKDDFDSNVFSFRYFPGLSPRYLEYLIDSPAKGVIIEALGMGSISVMENSLIPWINQMTNANKIIVINSQNPYGKINLNLYQCGKMIKDAGGISASDMTVSTSIVKLMFLLGYHKGNLEKVKKNFLKPLAGEVTE
jgi:L-asparaginase